MEILVRLLAIVRVGQINILNMDDGIEERFNKVVNFVKELNIDILAIQELKYASKLQALFREIGVNFYEYSDLSEDYKDRVAVFSKYPIVNSQKLIFEEDSRSGLLVNINTPSGDINIITAHFPHGFSSEAKRLSIARKVDTISSNLKTINKESPIIFAGDLNTEEDSDTLRFLYGKSSVAGYSTHWVDAWKTHGNKDNKITSDFQDNYWGEKTASKHCIKYLNILPKRRIDYILSYGWCYGKIGSPMGFGRFGEPQEIGDKHLSDHYGIYADILVSYPS